MSLNEILGSAMSGLAASQAGLRTVSNNIANVGTPGYARERISLSPGVTAGRTNGVVVGEPSRIADRFLEATVYRRAGDMGQMSVQSSYLDRLQTLLGAPGAEYGLPARLDAISASAVVMSGAQGSPQTVSAFTANVQDALTSMKQIDTDVAGLRADAESEIGYSVETINGLLKRIHDLNGTVARLGAGGRSSAGVIDQRRSAIEDLSGLVKITVREQPDGRVSIDSATGAALVDRQLRQLSYTVAGMGVAQTAYPTIDIRFADANGVAGAATGEKLDTAAVGGKLGGLLDLRDNKLPAFSEQLGIVFGGLAQTLNAASNASSTVPAPVKLEGRQTALTGADRLGFTGSTVFAVTKSNGDLVASTKVDFSALGAGATVDDAILAINTGLGGSGTASFVDGKLTITATGTGNGVAVAQDPASPSDRAGTGFSHYFGMNDIVRSADNMLVPSGFIAADAHGFAVGQSADIVLRDVTGRELARHVMTGSAGPTFGDLVTELNASPVSAFGDFQLDDHGRIRFQADAAIPGAMLSIASDSTDRLGTGRSFSTLSGLSGLASGLARSEVRPDILGNPSRLPLARLKTDALVGAKALGSGDYRGATAFVDQMTTVVDLGKDGVGSIERLSAQLLGSTGLKAAQAASAMSDAAARSDDAVNRRDSFSGVNIDEELAQMVVLQNSYSASARVMSTATQMYDTLLAMVG